MNEKSLEIYKNIPDAISDTIIMTEANSVIVIYEGPYSIKKESWEIKLDGKITYEWLANSGVYFYGNPITDTVELFDKIHKIETFSVFVDGLELGRGLITKFEIGNLTETKIRGRISQDAIFGDKSVSVQKIRFSIPNLREFYGLTVKRETDKNISTSADRLILEDDVFKITIDKCADFTERKRKLKESGGYIILYNGELTSKKGSLTHADIRDVHHCLSVFLTFLNGRRTSALFIQGVFEERIIWTDYTDYFVDPYKAVWSWPQKSSAVNFNELWRAFRLVWNNNSEDKNFLVSLIHWYVEANGYAGHSEGSIILAQTALELVYNWWIVERRQMILGKDSENISASNKIRLLVSQLNITRSIPDVFTELQKFKDTTDNVADAPDAIVYIRNAIVHSQEDKRKKLSAIHDEALYEALQVYIWYIELSLLCILEYSGDYSNRCSNEEYVSKTEQPMPWKSKTN